MIAVTWQLLGWVGGWFGTIDPNGALLGAVLPSAVLDAAMFALPVVCIGFAISGTNRTERRRLVWTSSPLCAFVITDLAWNVVYVIAPASGTPDLVQPSIDVVARYLRFPGFLASALIASP